MEQNIADMLKDAFSEVDTDFGSLQFDEGINPSQTQATTDAEFELKDTSQLWATSDLNEGSFDTFTKVFEPEQSEDPDPDPDSSTDSSEENELSNPSGFAIGPGQEMKYDKDQAAGKATSETPRARLEHQACIEQTFEEECCNSSDEGANDCMPSEFGVGDASILGEENTENDLSQEETIKPFQESVGNQGIQSKEHQELSTALASDENRTPEERSSGSEEEEEEEEEEENEEKELSNCNSGEPTDQTLHNVNRTESATGPAQEMDDQAAEKATSETSVVRQENQLHFKCAVEEEYSMHSDEDTSDSVPYEFVGGEASILGDENNGNDLNKEGTVQPTLGSVQNEGLQSKEHQEILLSPIEFGENQDQKEMSSGSEDKDDEEEEEEEKEEEEEEEGLCIYNTEEPTEQISQCDSGANMDKPLTSIQPNTAPVGFNEEDDLKEFTEEDQEGVEESLAEYPSDLLQSEGEETNKSAEGWASSLVDSSIGDDYAMNKKMKDLSSVEDDYLREQGVGSMDFTDFSINYSDPEITIKELEDQTISDQIKSDLSAPFLNKEVHKDDLQDSQTNYSSTNEEDASNPLNIQQDYDSDVSSDHSTGHEETILGDSSSSPSVRHEEEWKSEVQCKNITEDLGRGDHDINYIGTDPQDRGGIFPETDRDIQNVSPTWSNLVHSFILAEDRSPSELLNRVRDTNPLIPEGFLSSDEGNLPFDDYDWSLTVEEDSDYTENIEELDYDEDMEGVEQNERDWEQEKTRIEAFYKFYDDQVDAEDKSERNHKVTFCLDHESSEYDDQVDTEDKPEAKEHCTNLWDMPVDPPALSMEVISALVAYSEDRESSEYEEDSESSAQDLDTVPDTPVCAVKPEYHSESDDEPQEKPFYPEKPKVHPKKQQHIEPAQNACPGKSKCLTVLKSVLALGLMTVIGVVSFWWVTDNLDWMH